MSAQPNIMLMVLHWLLCSVVQCNCDFPQVCFASNGCSILFCISWTEAVENTATRILVLFWIRFYRFCSGSLQIDFEFWLIVKCFKTSVLMLFWITTEAGQTAL
ncbi:hypothetical protein ABBQ38_009203 [Trebouxia sp. C0009 RCD-2024]